LGKRFKVVFNMERTSVKHSVFFAGLTWCAVSFASVSEVMTIGTDTYQITAQANSGWSTKGAQKTKAYEKAHQFCAARGKEMQTIAVRTSSKGVPAYAELEFRCVAGK
jgi:hypothetical protein